MDPNILKSTPSPVYFKKTVVLIAIALLGLTFLALIYSGILKKTVPQPPEIVQQQLNPIPYRDPAIDNLLTVEGTVTAVTNSSISIKSSAGNQTFKLEGLLDIGKPSATEAGQTVKANLSELKIGASISIITLKASDSARLILIKP